MTTTGFDRDGYTWPRIAAIYDDRAVELNVHCLRNVKTGKRHLSGLSAWSARSRSTRCFTWRIKWAAR